MTQGKKKKPKHETRIIVGSTWTLLFTDEMPDGMDGICVPSQQKIAIRKSVPLHYKEETEIHEAIHAIISCTPLAQRLIKYHPDLEEEIAETLAPLLHAYMRANGKRYDA